MEACIDALESFLDGEVSGHAQLSCRSAECSFDADGLLSCSVAGSDDRPGAAWALGLFALGGLFASRRRRRRG